MFRKNPRGFTLLEIALALFIGFIILSSAVITYSRFIAAARMDQIAEEAVSILREARDKTLAREDGYAYGVHLDANQFILFRAPAYNAGTASNVAYAVPEIFRIDAISLTGGGASIIFQPLTGKTNTHGTFTIAHTGDRIPSTTIRIYETGVAYIE